MQVALTQKNVEHLTAPLKLTDYRDTKLKGLVLRVTPKGTKSFYCEFARGKRMFLGRADVLGLSEARERARETLADAYKGLDPLAAKKEKIAVPTYQEFLEEHYAVWARTNQKAHRQNMARLYCAFRSFLNKPMDQISAMDIEKWRAGEVNRGLSAETTNRDIASIKASFNRAVEWGILAVNPLSIVRKARTDSLPKVRFLSADEEERLRRALRRREKRRRVERDNANRWRKERGYLLLTDLNDLAYTDHLMPMILLSINTGLRRGELFDLLWSNVDLEPRILTVTGATAKSNNTRHVPLNREALAVLSAWRQQSAPETGRVFENGKGERFDNVNKGWKNILASAGIEAFRWHDMRHHFASRLAMSGVDLNTIRELLGHSDYAMTLRYAHLAPEHKHKAVRVLDT